MTLPLTPESLRAAYDFLSTTPPFKRWNLPDSDDVIFRVMRTRHEHGEYRWINGRHRISVSAAKHGYAPILLETMAHEMIHLYTECHDIKDSSHHGPVFRRLAARVCRWHGFDPKRF